MGQAGYVKLYEPAYERAKDEIADMSDIRFVQVNHLHPDNDLHVRQFRTRRFDDVPGDEIKRTKTARAPCARPSARSPRTYSGPSARSQAA